MDIVEDKDLEAVEATQGEVSPEELLSPDAETATQDETTEEEPKEEKAETVAYTDEEFDELHINDMDESRLTPTQKKYFLKAKDLEKGYTKKYEQLAHEKKQYETLSQRTIQTQQPQYADIYEAFDHDSKTVMQNLRQVLAQKKVESPNSDEVIRLEMLRDELMERKISQQENNTRLADMSNRVTADVYKAIPDFETKSEKLTEFATTELGLSIDEIKALTNPSIMGPMASKITVAVNKLYDIKNAGKGLKSKEVKKAPKTEKAGSGFAAPKEKSHGVEDYFALRRKNSA
jgi:hypothetical protein